MYQEFHDEAEFLTVYIREAHPDDEWQMDVNLKDDVCYLQPRTLEQRLLIANDFSKRFDYPVPLGVDLMSNRASELYAGWPERLYIIGEDGTITYKGGMGPMDYKPQEVRAWLEKRSEAVAAGN
jgi:hypothetical protein